MTVLDSGFHVSSTSQVLVSDSTSVDFGFQKVCFPGFRIPRPRFQIPKSIEFRILQTYFLNSEFHEQMLSRLRIPQANISWILDSTSKCFLDCGFHEQVFSGLRIPQANISWILDSTSKCSLDCGFHKKIFSGFQIPPANVFWIPEFGLPYMKRS